MPRCCSLRSCVLNRRRLKPPFSVLCTHRTFGPLTSPQSVPIGSLRSHIPVLASLMSVPIGSPRSQIPILTSLKPNQHPFSTTATYLPQDYQYLPGDHIPNPLEEACSLECFPYDHPFLNRT